MKDRTTRETVLVVDDELGVRRLIRQILSQDYVVLEAQDGEEAVAIAHDQKPDLILMDMIMPKMDGLTACRAIKQDQATGDITVVMLTAVDYSLNMKLAENVAGASAYITKPFKSRELLSTVGRLLSSKGQAPEDAGGEALHSLED
jgi:CheY-like chemotaxis protein